MEAWTQTSFSIRAPHQGIVLGFELFEPTEDENWYTWKFHLLFLTINYEYGYDDNPYNE